MPSLFMYDMPILVAFIGLCQGRQSVSKSLNQAVDKLENRSLYHERDSRLRICAYQ